MVRFLVRSTVLSVAMFALVCVSGASALTPPDIKTFVRRLDDLYRSSSSIGVMELTAKTETQSRHLKMRIWSKGKDKSLILIDEPAREAGTATLKVGNNLWNFLPKIARTIRIPPSMMLSPWMGTDFTNDDLVKDSSYEKDFTTTVEGRSTSPSGWKKVMKVRPGIVGRWQRIEFVVDDAGALPLMASYFDRKGRLARTMRFTEPKDFGGRVIPARMSLESVDQPGHQTEIHYLQMRFDASLDDDLFSLSQLERK